MVMGGDSCSRGRGFESRYRILDGHYFTFICSKNCVFGKTKINAKRGRVGPFLKRQNSKFNINNANYFTCTRHSPVENFEL